MKGTSNILGTVVASTLIVGLMALAGCNKGSSTDTTQAASDASAASAAQPASAASAYTPPTAAQLEQMVAPIALFPDKLVAQVLAGATYPDQIAAANQWLAQNPSLKGAALQNAANQQPWDVSVKSLTAFPAVLNQMAGNIQWTTALGEAYVNDPTDVMNAIQVMRQRAQQSGNLKSSKQLAVSSTARQAPPPDYQGEAGGPPVYAGPAVIPPPPQTIVIAPAQPDVVYVPTYDPNVVYGQPVPVYPGYVYHRPEYSTGEVVTAGVLTFGVGILVGDAISHHHDWGWHAWGMNWGGDRGYRGDGPGNGGNGGGWHRPAVVYNNNTYVSRSTTVVNRISNTTINNHYDTTRNVVNNNVVNNTTRIDNRNEGRPNPGQVPGQPPGNEHRPPGPPPANPGAMTMPHFTQGDMREGARPAQQPGGNPHAEGRPGAEAQPHGAGEPGRQAAGQPHAPQPNFGGQMGQMGQMQHGQPPNRERPAGEPPRMEQQHEPQLQREPHEAQPGGQAPHPQAEHAPEMNRPHPAEPAREQPRPQPQPQHEQPRPQPQQHEQPHPQPQQHEQPHPQQHEQQHEQPHGGGEHHEPHSH